MQFEFTVNSVHRDTFTRIAQFQGRDAEVAIPGLVVELVNEDCSMTMTRRFVPDDMAAAEALYVQGATIITTDAAPPPA